MENNYVGRFRPSVYLEFMNKRMISIEDYPVFFSDKPRFRLCHLTEDGKDQMDSIGNCVEECLDKAISAMNFEKEMK